MGGHFLPVGERMRGLRLFGLAGAFGALAAAIVVGCGEADHRWPQFIDVRAGLTGVRDCALAWGDYDNDGDLDLALAGWTGGEEVSKVYRNDGGVFTEISAGMTGVERCSLAWGDFDGDGDLDLALAGCHWDGAENYVSKVYRNDGGGVFTEIGAGLAGVSSCSLAWGDHDNDGDLDLALAGYWYDVSPHYESKVYRNDGGVLFADTGAGLAGLSSCSLAWGDYDNDGDLDLALAGYWYDGSGHYESKIYDNDGGGLFADSGAGLTGVQRCFLAWGDYDNDGDLDLALAGKFGDPVSKVYQNDAGSFTATGAGLTGVCDCSLGWGDYDNDGDLDLALVGWTGGQCLSKVYSNDGGGVFSHIGAGLTGVGLWDCSLTWGDYDNDGDLDLALAGSGFSKVYRNSIGVSNTPPAAPTGLSATPASGEATFSWNPATDAETPSLGLTYNLRVGTASGVDDVMPAMADLVTGERRIPAMGNVQHNTSWTLKGLPAGTYYWSVQAIDAAYAGSPWAPEETFTVP